MSDSQELPPTVWTRLKRRLQFRFSLRELMAVTFAAAVGSSVVAMLGKSHHPTLVDSTLVESSVRASDWSQGILAFIGALFTLGLINQVHDLWANAFGGGTFNPLSTLSHCLLGELGISISFSRKSTPI